MVLAIFGIRVLKNAYVQSFVLSSGNAQLEQKMSLFRSTKSTMSTKVTVGKS